MDISYNKKVKIGKIDGKIVMKTCNECNRFLELNQFSKNVKCIGQVTSKCKQCTNKLSNEKYKNASEEEKLKRSLKWKEIAIRDKDKISKYQKEYREKNKDKLVEYKKEWDKSNFSHLQEYKREHRKLNNEKYILSNRKWASNPKNKHLTIKHKQNRKARERSLPNTLDSWDDILKHFDYKCSLSDNSNNIVVEHFIPLSWGHGGTTRENCYPLSWDLNSSKAAKNPFTWYEQMKDKIDADKWNNLICYLAKLNNMSIEEFKEYVFWCEQNKREV